MVLQISPQEMESVLCMFFREDIMLISYVEDLIIFAETRYQSYMVKTNSLTRLTVMHINKAEQFSGIELVWEEDR